MRLKNIAAILLAAAFCTGAAALTADWIEKRSEEVVRFALIEGGHDWVDIETDGLRVLLSGTAPDEATRFRVETNVGRVIDRDRIVDQMEVAARADFAPPRFSIEMLRNGDGVSLIGLVPSSTDRAALASRVAALADGLPVTDMLDAASHPTPEGWDQALGYALDAMARLPRSKISVTPELVEIKAISESPKDKRRLETELARARPDALRLALNISAPRPVITPFTLRLTLDGDGTPRFDACSASSETSRDRIIAAAVAAGLQGKPECEIGLGAPTPAWPEAAEIAISGLTTLGGGSLTFSDADISIVALDTTAQGHFDRVIGDLEARLPDVFSLHAVLPEKVVVDGTGEDEDVVEFVATYSPEGLVQLRGRLPDDTARTIIGSYARAQFGSDAVYLATRNDADLPSDWSVRVLAGLQALAELESGSVVVQSEYVEVRGVTGSKTADDTISRILGEKLGTGANFDLTIRYDELLDETLNIPTPAECVERINKILAIEKIVFEPSSSEITPEAGRTIDKIAEVVKICDRVRMEVGGHTDSQGREIMNQELSQERADSVLTALRDRRVRTRAITARGYGEAEPIADNGSEAGREANRRIAFKLLTDVRVGANEPAETQSE